MQIDKSSIEDKSRDSKIEPKKAKPFMAKEEVLSKIQKLNPGKEIITEIDGWCSYAF